MTFSEAHEKILSALSDVAHGRITDAQYKVALQDFEQAQKAHDALITGRLVQLGVHGEDVDTAVESASDVWREAFESLREAYCTLWSAAQETGEQDSPELHAVESTLIMLLDLCRDGA